MRVHLPQSYDETTPAASVSLCGFNFSWPHSNAPAGDELITDSEEAGDATCEECVAESDSMTPEEYRRDQAERSGNSSANWGFRVEY